jgi:cellulose biosynthesis protein BcsQ
MNNSPANFRPKKIVFANNKGGVGKTTLCFNIGVQLSKMGLKVALIDLDPQCNLSIQCLGYDYFDNNISTKDKTIYDVLKQKIEGDGDVDTSVPLKQLSDNLYLSIGDLNLSLFDDLLLSAFSESSQGLKRGFSDTSAINRYLDYYSFYHSNNTPVIDIFLIDTSPSFSALNRAVFLGSDYFIVPTIPDSFSIKGVGNLGTVYDKWKKLWINTSLSSSVSSEIQNNMVLKANSLFIGYLVNNYNVYSEKMVKRQHDWLKKLPEIVKKNLSEKHGKNGLVEESWKNPLGKIQDLGQLTAISQEQQTAISFLTPSKTKELNLQGTKQLYEHAMQNFEIIANNILQIAKEY